MYHPFLVIVSSKAFGFLSEYKILVARAQLRPFRKVLMIMSLSVVNSALLTVSRNSLTYSLAVLFSWLMLSSFWMDSSFLSSLRKAALKAMRNTAGWPSIRSIGLFDHHFNIILLPSLSFSFTRVREDKNNLLFVSSEIFVRTSFKKYNTFYSPTYSAGICQNPSE